MMFARQLLILLIASIAHDAPRQDEPRFGRGPWIFLQRGDGAAVPALTLWGDWAGGIGQMRLDDGRIGNVSVKHATCKPPERCEPIDCGCLATDRYRVTVSDPFGAIVASTDVWAAYGDFHIVPFDLVDGPGDELLIVRVLGRSAPPKGHDLKILQITSAG